MKILYISLKADFGADGDESKGYSYEYSHIWDAWLRLMKEDSSLIVKPWWIDQSDPSLLSQMIKEDEFDFIFALPVNWHNDAPFQLLEQATAKGIPIIQFDCDPLRRFNKPGDPWILERFRRKLATHFLCPAPHVVPQYEGHDMPVKVMHFGCPSWIDKDLSVTQDIDISFVGQCHGLRNQVITELRDAGLVVSVFGHFWPDHEDNHDAVSEEEMNTIFNRSKVNLNLTWISQPPYQHQIKGRHFELLGAGAAQVATYGHDEMQGLEEVMQPNVDFYQVFTIDEVIEKIYFLLENTTIRKVMGMHAHSLREKNLWTTRLKEFMEYWPEWRLQTLQ